MGSGADCCKEKMLKDITKANDRQVGGDHYKAPGKTEHWDIVIEHDLDYFQSQVTKYIMRWKKKNGLQDLKKAQHFLEKYIESIESGKIIDPTIKHASEKHCEAMEKQYGIEPNYSLTDGPCIAPKTLASTI